LSDVKLEETLQNRILDKKDLLEIIKKILKTEADLAFLSNLPEKDLKTLVTCIRERFDQLGDNQSKLH